MSKSPIYLSSKLISHFRYIDLTRKKMDQLYSRGDIVRRDIEMLYSGLYLETCTSFERFLESLFIELLIDNRLAVKTVYASQKIFFKSIKVAKKVVFGGRKYVDWFPYKQTEERAEAFFRSGRPFTCLDKNDKKTLDKIMIMRNAIAHKSDHSIKRFEEELIMDLPLPPRERTPAGFLRSIFRSSPPQTRFENLTIEICTIANKLCT